MFAFKTLQGASWLVFSRAMGRLIDFFTLLVLARILTPSDFGLVALAMSLVVVVDTILEIPVTQALIRLDRITQDHLDTGFTLGMLRSGVIAVIIIAALWPFALINHKPELMPLILFLSLGPVIRGFYSPAMVNFSRALGFRQTFLMEFGGKIVAFTAAITTVLAGGSYWALAANFVGASLASTMISYWLAPYRPRLSLGQLQDFAGFIGWFTAAQLVSALNWQFDRLLIGFTSDQVSLGRYAVASDLATSPTQSLIGPALQSVMAAFSLIASDHDRMKSAFLKTARFAMLISLPACVGISLTSDLTTTILLGEKWREAAPYLHILALSVIPIPYFQVLYSVSLATSKPYVVFWLNIIDLSFRLVLLSIGLYLYAGLGVSYARVVLSAIMTVFYLYYARKILGIGMVAQLQNIWKIAVATLVMTISVAILRNHISSEHFHPVIELAITAATGASIYIFVLYILGTRVAIGSSRLEIYDGYNIVRFIKRT
ncbi:lipopolysaccharide biosynthesis protein [Allorhizobium sp. BGMRC 0089]|uniref:lipopolysaccharide biosynthesis protein n=1 Tax=Allorhizobium sonneratiae TaxID=2934936 RepID=UPI0020332440|nr:lipopolysaccharide biosynthesis protein [Allorhizobium sonneratiae]MCM2293298.1 lipopolysaccharide biosynthesis protein [Allorhizobium sonneratiae]